MRTIRIYGKLAKLLGRCVFQADVSSPAEAVRFLTANFPFIEEHILNGSYRVKIGKTIITEEALRCSAGMNESITIIPVIAGAGAVGKIIAGVFLIAASFLIPGVAIAGIALAPIAFGIGASLVLGGVAQLLTPTTSTKAEDPKETYSFSGIQNTTRAGVSVPICYGETVVGSVVIGSGLSVEKI